LSLRDTAILAVPPAEQSTTDALNAASELLNNPSRAALIEVWRLLSKAAINFTDYDIL